MADNEHPWEAALARNVLRFRERTGISQTALAKALAERGLPFHQPTIQRIEAGTRPVRLNEALVIADALGMHLDDLIAPADAEAAARRLDLARIAAAYAVQELADQVRAIHARIESARDGVRAALTLYRSSGGTTESKIGAAELIAERLDELTRATDALRTLYASEAAGEARSIMMEGTNGEH